MKYLLTLLAFLSLATVPAFAQVKLPADERVQSMRYSGIRAGVNVATISNMAESDSYLGFHLGITGTVETSEGFGYGGELTFSQQGVMVQNITCALNYLTLPLYLNFNAHPVTFQAGLYGAYLFSANAKAGQQTKDISGYLQENDYGLLVGLNFNTSGPIFFSARFNLGLQDINNGFAIPKETEVRNRTIQVGAGYKFLR